MIRLRVLVTVLTTPLYKGFKDTKTGYTKGTLSKWEDVLCIVKSVYDTRVSTTGRTDTTIEVVIDHT